MKGLKMETRIGDIKILVGAPGHGYGAKSCNCKQCQSGNGIGGKYTINILRDDGTFVHGVFNENNDTRIDLGKTKIRVQNGPWAEKVTFNNNGKMILQSLSISEAINELDKWNDIRNYNGYSSYKSIKKLDLSRITHSLNSPDYDTLKEKYKK